MNGFDKTLTNWPSYLETQRNCSLATCPAPCPVSQGHPTAPGQVQGLDHTALVLLPLPAHEMTRCPIPTNNF